METQKKDDFNIYLLGRLAGVALFASIVVWRLLMGRSKNSK